MQIDLIKDYSVITRIASHQSPSERVYGIRFQDHVLPTLFSKSFLETYGNGYAIRKLTMEAGALKATSSFGSDSYALLSTPIEVFGQALYITRNHRIRGLSIHDWDRLVMEIDLFTKTDPAMNDVTQGNFMAYTDGGLTVYTAEQLGFSMVEDEYGDRHAEGLDTYKYIVVLYKDFDYTEYYLPLSKSYFTDVLPMRGQIVKFNRERERTDFYGHTEVNVSYFTSPIAYEGPSRETHEKLFRTEGRRHSVLLKFPAVPLGFCGMNVIEGRHLLLYKLKSNVSPKARYVLFEIEWKDGKEFVLTDQIDFYY